MGFNGEALRHKFRSRVVRLFLLQLQELKSYFFLFCQRRGTQNGYASALRGKCETGQARSGRDNQCVQCRRLPASVPVPAPYLQRVISLGGPCTIVQSVAQWSEEMVQRARWTGLGRVTEIKITAGLRSCRCARLSGDAEGSRVQQNAALAASELREARRR
jgi:hypothetical protein